MLVTCGSVVKILLLVKVHVIFPGSRTARNGAGTGLSATNDPGLTLFSGQKTVPFEATQS